MPRTKIKLITLDLDDTLWPNTKVIVAAENAMWKFILSKFPDLKKYFSDALISDIRTALVKKDPSLKFDLTRFRKAIIKTLLLDHGAEESSATYYSNAAFNEFFKVRNKVQLYRDAKIMLERLSRKVNIVSLSNGNADLSLIGINNFFVDQVSSKDVQSNKPSAGHFNRALEIGKCQPKEALHIGDCPINDIGGARNCNFNTLWFNCDKRKWDEIVPCELQAKTWKEVYLAINKNFILEKVDV